MTESAPLFLDIGEGAARRRIAVRHRDAAEPGGPGLLWLIGLKSDMSSTKAEALDAWTRERAVGMTRFDYSGHGLSSGRFEDATVSDWLEEADQVFRRVTKGPQIVVGSSTGAHVALLLLRKLQAEGGPQDARLRSLVLIAPAWDVTELIWRGLPQEAKDEVMDKGAWVRPSAYDPGGYVITRRLIEDGRKHLLAGKAFDPGRPVAILQGVDDRDVPVAHARALMTLLTGGWATLTEVPDGEHRLSRPEDLALLYGLIEKQLAGMS